MQKTTDSRFNTKTGWLCLDFANTVGWHSSAQPEESLSTYSDLVLWAKQMKILSSVAANEMIKAGEKEPVKAENILSKAIELREAIYRIFVDRARCEKVNEKDLSILNDALAKMMPHLQLSVDSKNFVWDWTIDTKRLDSILWPVVWSTAELLNSDALERVGQCADEKCGWLFWDNSRNRSRCWCDMQDCGNRAKSRRHYQRTREQTQ